MKKDIIGIIKIPVTILEIKPDAVYMEKTYTQNVIIEFTNNQKIEIFDHMMLCPNSIIGKNKKIQLELLTLLLAKSEGKNIQIIPDINSTIQEFICRIEAILPLEDPLMAEKWHDAIIDIGVGKIVADVNLEKYENLNLKVGDFIHIKGRVDLVSIE
jgi:hypothetical protein